MPLQLPLYTRNKSANRHKLNQWVEWELHQEQYLECTLGTFCKSGIQVWSWFRPLVGRQGKLGSDQFLSIQEVRAEDRKQIIFENSGDTPTHAHTLWAALNVVSYLEDLLQSSL